jgi:hypothetical protein
MTMGQCTPEVDSHPWGWISGVMNPIFFLYLTNYYFIYEMAKTVYILSLLFSPPDSIDWIGQHSNVRCRYILGRIESGTF